MLALSMFPVSLSKAKTDESFVATTKTFFSKFCRLQVLNCVEMMPRQISLAIWLWNMILGPSVSTSESCYKSKTLLADINNIKRTCEFHVQGKKWKENKLTSPRSDPMERCLVLWLTFRESIEPLTLRILTLWIMWLFPFFVLPEPKKIKQKAKSELPWWPFLG